jgi:hypothetical protein
MIVRIDVLLPLHRVEAVLSEDIKDDDLDITALASAVMDYLGVCILKGDMVGHLEQISGMVYRGEVESFNDCVRMHCITNPLLPMLRVKLALADMFLAMVQDIGRQTINLTLSYPQQHYRYAICDANLRSVHIQIHGREMTWS